MYLPHLQKTLCNYQGLSYNFSVSSFLHRQLHRKKFYIRRRSYVRLCNSSIRQSSFWHYSQRTAVAIRTNSTSKGEFNSAELEVRNRLFLVRETPEISRVHLDVLKGSTEKRYGQRVERKRNGIETNVELLKNRRKNESFEEQLKSTSPRLGIPRSAKFA